MNKNLGFLIYFSCIVLFGKIAGFLKDILITYFYGVSATTDAFFLAASISALLYMAIYSAIPIVSVPLATKLTQEDEDDDEARPLTMLLIFFICMSLLVSILSILFANKIVHFFTMSRDSFVLETTASYLKIMSMGYIFSTIVAFYNAIQTTKGFTLYSYIVPIVNNLIFCIGIFFFRLSEDFREILILGNLSWLFLCFINYLKTKQWFKINMKSISNIYAYQKYLIVIFPAMLLFFIEQSSLYVTTFFASQLTDGAVSIVMYSNKLNSIVLTLVSLYLTTVALPKFSNLAHSKSHDKIQIESLKYIQIILYVSIPILGFVCLYRYELVSIIFERGKFTYNDVTRVSQLFGIFIFILPLSILRDLFNRIYFSSGNTLGPMLISLLSLFLNIVLSYYLFNLFGLLGLAMASVAAVAFGLTIIFYATQEKFALNLLRPSLKTLLEITLYAIIPNTLLLFIKNNYSSNVLVGLIIYSVIYLVILAIFNKKIIRLILTRQQIIRE